MLCRTWISIRQKTGAAAGRGDIVSQRNLWEAPSSIICQPVLIEVQWKKEMQGSPSVERSQKQYCTSAGSWQSKMRSSVRVRSLGNTIGRQQHRHLSQRSTIFEFRNNAIRIPSQLLLIQTATNYALNFNSPMNEKCSKLQVIMMVPHLHIQELSQ